MDAANQRHDIATRDDCARLTRAFYAKAMDDHLIGFIFTDIAKLDLEAHLPVITSFWETILLGAQSYRGGAFAKHAQLHAKAPLQAGHFNRWLVLWKTTVDELFEGPVAEQAKAHAERVAGAFHRRLNGLPEPDAVDSPLLVALPLTQHGQG